MDRIEKEAIRMGGLVEDLLALARLDEAKPLELAEVDLVPLARDAALDAMAANPGRTVTVIAPEELGSCGCRGQPVARPRGRPRGRPAGDRRDLVRRRDARAAARTTPARRGVAPDAAARRPEVGRSGIRCAEARPVGSSRRLGRRRAATTVADLETPRDLAERRADERHGDRPVRRAVVLAEENKIRQVITNLMGNAIRFTSDDSPIDIRVSIDDAGRARR